MLSLARAIGPSIHRNQGLLRTYPFNSQNPTDVTTFQAIAPRRTIYGGVCALSLIQNPSYSTSLHHHSRGQTEYSVRHTSHSVHSCRQVAAQFPLVGRLSGIWPGGFLVSCRSAGPEEASVALPYIMMTEAENEGRGNSRRMPGLRNWPLYIIQLSVPQHDMALITLCVPIAFLSLHLRPGIADSARRRHAEFCSPVSVPLRTSPSPSFGYPRYMHRWLISASDSAQYTSQHDTHCRLYTILSSLLRTQNRLFTDDLGGCPAAVNPVPCRS